MTGKPITHQSVVMKYIERKRYIIRLLLVVIAFVSIRVLLIFNKRLNTLQSISKGVSKSINLLLSSINEKRVDAVSLTENEIIADIEKKNTTVLQYIRNHTEIRRSLKQYTRQFKTLKFVDYSQCVRNSFKMEDVVKPAPQPLNISVVTTLSMMRLFMLPSFAEPWKGPVVFVILAKEEEEERILPFLQQHVELCDARIQVLVLVAGRTNLFYTNYPINFMRNIGVLHTSTSHYLMVDADIRFSYDAYKQLMSLCTQYAFEEKTAVVLPVLFAKRWTLPDLPFQQQFEKMEAAVPRNLSALKRCIMRERCSDKKGKLFTHVYLKKEWTRAAVWAGMQPYYSYLCWDNRYQEPYVIVKRNDNITLFYEDLINYGKNKIVYIENLRLHGYSFILAGSAFAFDVPHSPSEYQKEHLQKRISKNLILSKVYLNMVYSECKGKYPILPLCGHQKEIGDE